MHYIVHDITVLSEITDNLNCKIVFMTFKHEVLPTIAIL